VLSLACGFSIVPVSETDCGLPLAVSAISKVAALCAGVLASGISVTLMMQLCPGFSGNKHRLKGAKSRESPPVTGEIETLLTVTGVLPVFVTVTTFDESVPTYTLPKLMLLGDIFTVLELGLFTVCETVGDVPPVKVLSPE